VLCARELELLRSVAASSVLGQLAPKPRLPNLAGSSDRAHTINRGFHSRAFMDLAFVNRSTATFQDMLSRG
jgi:hypothetical protein